MFKLTLIKSDQSKSYDITPLVGEISWDSEFTITSMSEFDIVISDTKFFPKNPCDLGDLVILTKGTDEVFRKIIVNENGSGRNPVKYSAYDFSWYLSNSTSVYQFNRISADQAITKVLTDFNLKIGSMLKMPTIIDDIYIQKTPGSIIQTIIEKVEQNEGYKINAEMREGKIFFEKRKDLLINGKFNIAKNIEPYDINYSISDVSKTRSIESMRNRIRLIVADDETGYEITAQTQNDELIKKFGLLEETIKIGAEDAAKSRQVAKILLQRLGKVFETNSISFMGDIKFKSGRQFDLIDPITGLSGRYMIASAKHKVSKQIHTMDLELVLPEDVI